MLGRYSIELEQGLLLFDIIKRNGKTKVSIEPQWIDMKITPEKVEVKDSTITLNTVFFIFPDKINTLKMEYRGSCYVLDGELALVGKISGAAEPYTGKTKFDVMVEELPKYRTGNRVYRTEEEVSQQVENLLSKMTLAEKIGQMSQAVGRTDAIGGEIKAMPVEEQVAKGMTGSYIAMGTMETIFELQKIAVEKSRLGIPLLFCQDVIHGYQTVFPIPLAWSCSFDTDAVRKATRASAKEATPHGIMVAFSPMVDIARDPRWGRVSEGAGEDPYLGSLISKAQVEGYQGESLLEDDSMMACLKHFIGYSAAEAGREYNTVEISETTLRNVYLPPFQAGIDAGAACVMNAFNIINGVPVAANKAVLKDLLRDEMGFKGIVVSDFAAVAEIVPHGAAEDGKDAACKAAAATMDIEMATPLYNRYLAELVSEGKLDEEIINDSVRRILTYKYKIGIMDDPFKYFRPEDMENTFSEEYNQVSREVAQKSIVLLKNNGILPLDTSKTIALIGPKAESTDLLGPWQFSKFKGDTVTLADGLRAKGVDLIIEKGCNISTAIEDGIERAVQAAKDADIVLLALGEEQGMSGEAASRQNITVPEVQMQLAQAVKNTGKPVVLVLTNGRPLLLNWFEDNADAILETWFLGSQAGNAIADVLVGEYNPSGKLSMSFPRHLGQVPVYYNEFSSGRPYVEGDRNKFLSKYIDGPNLPLYPFGYGLSYTTFTCSNLMMSKHEMTKEGNIQVSLTVTNTGSVEGEETIQLYIRDVAASIVRPVKELKGIQKLILAPGQSTEVTFTITEPMLRFYNQNNEKVSEAGKFIVMVGNSSRDKDLIFEEFYLK
jgi:beta-glucosidase